MQESTNIIYYIENKSNNKLYFGKATNVTDPNLKFSRIKRSLNNGTFKSSEYLQSDWSKYGESNFKFVVYAEVDDPKKLQEKLYRSILNNGGTKKTYNDLPKDDWEMIRHYQRKDCKTWNVNDSVYRTNGYFKELDYNLEFAKDRAKLVRKILRKDDKWLSEYVSSIGFIDKQVKKKTSFLSEDDLFCNNLSKLVDYIDFAKFNNEKQKIRYYTLSKNKKERDKKREQLVSDTNQIDESKMVKNEEKRRKKTDNYKLIPPQTINESDLNDHIEIKRYNDFILYLENQIRQTEDLTKKRRLKKIYKECKKDILVMKDMLRGTIYFKKLCGDTTEFDLGCDTGYFNGDDYVLVSENKINYKDEKHIFAIIDNYSMLRESCYETPDSELWAILHDVDNLIESTPFEYHVKDILIMKIDGLIADDICKDIKEKYNIELTEVDITRIYNNQIPKQIVDTYLDLYEEFIYTYKKKGIYKKCGKCGEIKLAQEKYFSKKKDSKDGLHPYCKKCR